MTPNTPLSPGGYAYVAPATRWTVANAGNAPVCFHWIRKAYQSLEGVDAPGYFVTSDHDVEPVPMPDTDGAWATTRFVDGDDMRHDMHVNIVTFQPGASIPFAETHVMEHGLYVLEGKAVYRSTRTGWRSRPVTTCGCAPSVRRAATPVDPGRFVTCCTKM